MVMPGGNWLRSFPQRTLSFIIISKEKLSRCSSSQTTQTLEASGRIATQMVPGSTGDDTDPAPQALRNPLSS
ncbi:hypothetical protein AGR4B_pAt20330 [Agrobacterium tumefaciens str. CFBP 5621]|nr:hypothetical protein AGR4B_pAt20330 [Agrobacterium tumefaciens str. CFBP 5621]